MNTRKNQDKRASLLSATLAADKQALFLKKVAEHRSDWNSLRASLQQEGISTEEIQQMELVNELADITGDNADLVTSLQKDLGSVREMALTYDRKKIHTLVKNSQLAEEFPGETTEEQKANYASHIEKQLFQKEPSAVITRMVKSGELPIKDKSIRDGVLSFFEQQTDFNIHKTSVYAAARAEKAGLRKVDPLQRTEVMETLKSIQRISTISTDPALLPKMMAADLSSAHKIASQPKSTFVSTYASELGGEAAAEQVYEQAASINTRNEFLLSALRDKVTGASVAAIDGNTGKQEAMAIVQQLADQNNLQLNWEALFGNADLCECDECRSVYSAAAYLVELLQYIRAYGDGVNPLATFLQRRPDIGNLQLTCENANTALPFIDIINEVMESFVAHLPDFQSEGNVQLEVHNVLNESSEELLAIPQHTNYNAYRTLHTAVYPFSLPYHQPLDATRLLLQKGGASRYNLMETFGIPKGPYDEGAMTRAKHAEMLGLSREECIILTKEDFYPKEYYAARDNTPVDQAAYENLIGVKPAWQYYGYNTENEMVIGLRQVKKGFLPRTGISFRDLIELLETRYINTNYPQGAALAMLNRIPYSYRFLQTLIVNSTDPAVKYAQIISLLEKAFTLPADKVAVRNWVLQHFEQVGLMTVLEWGGTTPGSYYYYGTPTPPNLRQIAQTIDISKVTLQHLNGSALNAAEYSRIMRFIRLWRKLNWSIQETDAALMAIVHYNNITHDHIQALAWIKKLIAHTGLPVERVLVCGHVLPTHGELSLYRKLFLSPNILAIDPVFAPDANGNYLAGSPTISGHWAGVLAALQLSAEDAATIQVHTNMTDELSIWNLSAFFRYTLLARYLKLPVKRLLQLASVFGNPFQQFKTTYEFIIFCEDIQAAKFKPEQLSYLMLNTAEPGVIPTAKNMLAMARTLYDGLRSNENKFAIQETISEDELRQQLMLVFNDETANKIIALLSGSVVFTAEANANMNIVLPAHLQHRITYDNVTGTLTSKGILDDIMWADVRLLFSKDQKWRNTVKTLAAQPDLFVGDTLFAIFPAGSTERDILLEPDGGGSGMAQGKIDFFYGRFMPFLKQQQARKLIIESMAAGLQADTAVTEWLLTTALTNTTGDQPLITDIEGVAQQTVSGNIWDGYISPAANDEYTFVITAAQQPSLFIDGQQISVLPAGDHVNQYETTPLKLKGGQLYTIQVGGINSDLSLLGWKTPTVPKMQVPIANLFPNVANEAFATAYERLHKALAFINGFSLGAEELKQLYLYKEGFAEMNFNNITLSLWRRFREYTLVRNRYKEGRISLAGFLTWAHNPVNGVLAEKIVALTGWDLNRVEQLISPAQFNIEPASFVNEQPLVKLQQALSLVAATGIEPGTMISWAVPLFDFNACHQIAENIRSSMRARYTQDDWQQVIKPVNDQLRTNQRNALISYLLVQPALQQWAANRDMELDANTLFDFFLLDVQMETAVETSRIRQAISSVQTFVQRCFLGLEKEISTGTLDRARWEWMQQYRTWEANRKVFLYPENWIEPDLRDSKTPFFEELEAELLQQDITPELVENAVRNYLTKLDEISNPDVTAIYQEWRQAYSGTIPYKEAVVSHVFARTRNIPYSHFYRTLDHYKKEWSPWEKIETDIQLTEDDTPGLTPAFPGNGNYLVPVKWKNRLLLFWPVFTKKTIENAIDNKKVGEHTMVELSGKPSNKLKQLEYREIRLAWSEYINGKWTARQTSGHVLNTFAGETAPDIKRFFFIQETKDEQVNIYAYWQEYNNVIVHVGGYAFSDGNKIIPVPTVNYDFFQHFPKNGTSKFMNFYPQSAGPVDITHHDLSGTENIGLLFNKTLADYKLVRTLQRDFHNFYDDYEVTFAYQEHSSSNAHNRTLIGYSSSFLGNWDISNLYHPYTGAFLKALNKDGLPGLLNTITQQNRQFSVTAESYATVHVYQWPDGGVDFGTNYSSQQKKETYSPYSIYNWELFFHVPLLVADRLSKTRQFEQARNWFHYIFNPLAAGNASDAKRYWQFLPFKTSPIESISSILHQLQAGGSDSDIEAWRNDPYNPHLIARTRPTAYMKTVVMKYLDNLIAWGDHLYRQNTMETINQSLLLYVMAGHILGPRPQVIPERGSVKTQTYNSLKDQWDAFGNAMVEMELVFPYSGQVVYQGGNENGKPYRGNNLFGFGASLYFGIPNNPKLIQYWDTVADRLFKIRHSMNIDGMVQQLALFEPPIDPALLVQAAAKGISLSSVLNDFNVSMPYYRFNYLVAKAHEMCSEVKALGQQLLSVIERRDAEAMARLRSTHEINLLNVIAGVKMSQLEEARAQLESLYKTRDNTGKRLTHYQQLLGITPEIPVMDGTYREVDGMYGRMAESGGLKLIDLEREDMNKSLNAAQKQTLAGVMEAAAGIANFFPSMSAHGQPLGVGVSAAFGGQNIGAALAAGARGIQIVSARLQFEAGAAAKKTGFLRQRQEWILQANSTGNEIMQLDKQIIAAKIRISIAEKELQNHQTQTAQAKEVQDFLTSKYTSQQLYLWMEGQVRSIYRQAYQLAYDLARKAEKAYRFERAQTNTSFIQLAYWDGSRDGLLAGEQLSLAIRQMEKAYAESHKRDYEITKHISLAQWDPIALINLKETGSCELQLPEELFDLDFPGHYMRRIKSMGVSIPCVAGPYTSVSATLTLLQDKTRVKSLTGSQYAEDTSSTDDRFVNNFVQLQSIATSNAQHDNGLFELNFRDERFVPFEGAGTVSRWKLELPAAYRQFDYDTIPDVIFHLQYTAREGGGMLKEAAIDNLNSYVQNASGDEEGLTRLISLRHEFSNEWHRFKQAVNGTHTLSVTGLYNRLPFFTKSSNVTGILVTGIELLVRGTLNGISLNGHPLNEAAAIGDVNHFTATGNFPSLSEDWHFTATGADCQEAWLVINYSLQTN